MSITLFRPDFDSLFSRARRIRPEQHHLLALAYTQNRSQQGKYMSYFRLVALFLKTQRKRIMSTHKHSIAMAVSASILGSVLTMSVAFAQETQAEDIEQIAVVGMRTPLRSLSDSPVPIDVISAEDLTKTGFTELNQMVAALVPSYNFPRPMAPTMCARQHCVA